MRIITVLKDAALITTLIAFIVVGCTIEFALFKSLIIDPWLNWSFGGSFLNLFLGGSFFIVINSIFIALYLQSQD